MWPCGHVGDWFLLLLIAVVNPIRYPNVAAPVAFWMDLRELHVVELWPVLGVSLRRQTIF